MLGFISSLNQMRTQAKSYKHQGKLHSLNARAARTHANAQAALIEFAGQQQQEIANRNLRTARENQRSAIGTARSIDAASGFTSQGTGNTHARQAQLALDAEIENMALSASIASHNAWQTARDTIKQGKVTALQHQAQAEQYYLAAKATRESMLYTGIAGAIGAAGSALGSAYSTTMSYNNALATAHQNGSISTSDYLNMLHSGPTFTLDDISAANTGLNTAAGFANSSNPYTATMTPSANNRKNNWGSNLSILLGRTPYTTPQAGNIFNSF